MYGKTDKARVVTFALHMSNDDYRVERLTPAERLDALLDEIEQDMRDGELSAACNALREIKANPTMLTLLNRFSRLRDRYQNLSSYCR